MERNPQRLEGIVSAVQTADSGSFSAAARVLGLTPAAVSKSVAALEAGLGARLFNRTTRTLSLTDEGRRFLAQARKALDELGAATDGLSQRQAEPQGLVRVSVGAGFGRRHVLPQLAAFAARYPKVQVELNLNDRAVDLVREGFDVGIRGSTAPPPGMVARKACALPLVLVASRSYARTHGLPRQVAELDEHTLIGTRFQSGQHSAWEFAQGRQRTAFLPTARLWLSDPEATLDAALLGMGIAQTGLYHAWPYLQRGALVPVLAGQHQPGERTIALFYPHRAGLALRVRVFVDFMLQGLAQDPALRATLADVRALAAQQAVAPATIAPAAQAAAKAGSPRSRVSSTSTKRAS